MEYENENRVKLCLVCAPYAKITYQMHRSELLILLKFGYDQGCVNLVINWSENFELAKCLWVC